jgi:hypothetical protein
MNWLDLGWLKTESGWEFHPWGPFTRGYLLGEGEGLTLRRRVRRLRAYLVALVFAGLASLLFCPLSQYEMVVWGTAAGLFLGGAEAIGIWALTKGLPRTHKPMGFQKGSLYLSKWAGPKLGSAARILCLLLVMLSAYGVWIKPWAFKSYLVLGFFLLVSGALHYINAVHYKNK